MYQTTRCRPLKRLCAHLLACGAALPLSASMLSIKPSHPDGIYASADPVAWHIRAVDTQESVTASYSVLKNGGTTVVSGNLKLGSEPTTLSLPADLTKEPATWLLKVRTQADQTKSIEAFGGAVVDPRAIRPASPKPDDFDTYWDSTMAAQRALPFDARIENLDSGSPDILLQTVSLQALDGSRARAQLARPREGGTFPALVILQWAGIYGLDKETVLARAAQGWLALNVLPHDLPLYEEAAFYEAQKDGPLRDFGTIGNHDRDQAYLRGILLRAARAIDYLASRPDWDGRTLIATGTSMGGFQAIAVAALDARITAVAANVPAACEHSAPLFGRGASWPYWLKHPPEAHVLDPRHQAGQTLDAVHFASRVHVPVLLSAGLIDTSCPPSGILAMASQLQGPVQLILMPLAPHQDPHTAFHDAAATFITPHTPSHSP